jgi:electron transport complex protein RnfC
MPLIQRVVTVTGPAIGKPSNLLVRIGTPIRTVLEHCQIDYSRAKKILMGGPMMGIAQSSLDAPVIKSTSGLLVLDETHPGERAYNCISCGNCVRACPIKLVPSYTAKFLESGDFEQAENWNCMDCIECGSCSYVCPAKINLVHFMKLGKLHITAARAKAAANKKAA